MGIWLTGVALNGLSRRVFKSCIVAHESLAALVQCSANPSCVEGSIMLNVWFMTGCVMCIAFQLLFIINCAFVNKVFNVLLLVLLLC